MSVTQNQTISRTAYFKLMRLDHWIKNIFILPGAFFAFSFEILPKQLKLSNEYIIQFTLGFFALCLASSANYVINEWLDRRQDAIHPFKNHRVANRYNLKKINVIALYLMLFFVVLILLTHLNQNVRIYVLLLLVMGVFYNVKPFRLKDRCYFDVISESVNNPIRLSIGWHTILPTTSVPASAFLGFWGMGIFLMSLKRYAEIKLINDPKLLGTYRKSFLLWTPEKLLTFSMIGAVVAASFLGILLARHRVEYILLFPIIIWVFAIYLEKSLNLDPLSYAPEKIIRNKKLVSLIFILGVMFVTLTFVDVNFLREFIDLDNP